MKTFMNFMGALIIIAIVVAGYLYYKGYVKLPKLSNKENIKVTQFDPTSFNAGFPTDLPLEEGNITERNSLFYPDRGVTLYSVSYTSGKQMEELYALYDSYFTTKGYTISNQSKSAAMMSIEATKSANDITVTITPQGGHILVKLAVVYKSGK